jgi:small subunit ribosomal protein S20
MPGQRHALRRDRCAAGALRPGTGGSDSVPDYRNGARTPAPEDGTRTCDPARNAILCGFAPPRTASSMATSTKAKKKTVRIASGLKRVRQDVKLNAANTALRSKFRTVIKNVQKAVAAGDKAKAAELFKTAQPVIDSIADKDIFHKNKAARHKSRLSAKIKAMSAPA